MQYTYDFISNISELQLGKLHDFQSLLSQALPAL